MSRPVGETFVAGAAGFSAACAPIAAAANDRKSRSFISTLRQTREQRLRARAGEGGIVDLGVELADGDVGAKGLLQCTEERGVGLGRMKGFSRCADDADRATREQPSHGRGVARGQGSGVFGRAVVGGGCAPAP